MNQNQPVRPPTRPALPPGKFAQRPPHNKPERKPDEQVRILTAMRDEKALVQITLLTGIALTGQIRAFDQYTVTLLPPSGNGSELLIFKSGILSIGRKLQAAAV